MKLQSSTTIVIVDDHAVVREGLKLLLNSQQDMQVIAEAADGATAIQTVSALNPDITIVDLAMRGLHGIATTIRLRQVCPSTRILAFTIHEDQSLVREMMEVGASGYVLKRSPPDELLIAIRAIAKGGTYIDRIVAAEQAKAFPKTANADSGTALSSRENEVLRLLAAGHTNKEIAESLGLSVKTIETYKARILQKLHMHTRADMVRYAIRRGLLEDL